MHLFLQHPLRRVIIAALVVVLLGGCSLFGSDPAPVSSPTGSSPAAPQSLPVTDAPPVAAADVRSGGSLRLAVPALPRNFNPAQTQGFVDDADAVLSPTTGGAVRLADDGSWSVDRDYARSVRVVRQKPLTVEIRLNPRAVWQGGTPITSRDMAAYARAVGGASSTAQVATQDGWDDIARVQPQGRFGYRVVFSEARSDWPLFVYPRLPAAVSQKTSTFNAGFRQRAVPSNGPFRVRSIVRKTGTVTLDRNPRWWGTTPRLQRVVIRAAAADVAAQAFGAGELDAVAVNESNASVIDDLDDDQVVVRRSSGAAITQLTLQSGQGPLRDRRVRRAVRLALDRSALARAQASALGTPATTADSLLVAPGQPGYRAGDADDADPAAARSALRKAGYATTGGRARRDGRPLTLRLRIPSADAATAQRARLVADQLESAGITVKVSSVAPETFYADVLVPLDFDLTLLTWDAPPLGVRPVEARFRPKDSPLNFTGVSDPHGRAWDRASRTLDPQRRASAVRNLDRALLADTVSIPLLGVPEVVAVSPRVARYGAHARGAIDWTRVGLRGK